MLSTGLGMAWNRYVLSRIMISYKLILSMDLREAAKKSSSLNGRAMHDENIILNELTGCFRIFLFLRFSLELPYKHSCSRSYCPSVRR